MAPLLLLLPRGHIVCEFGMSSTEAVCDQIPTSLAEYLASLLPTAISLFSGQHEKQFFLFLSLLLWGKNKPLQTRVRKFRWVFKKFLLPSLLPFLLFLSPPLSLFLFSFESQSLHVSVTVPDLLCTPGYSRTHRVPPACVGKGVIHYANWNVSFLNFCF